jgi:thiamine-monophosphate kinase
VLFRSPKNLGYKSLAVNLSDIAAMGARPRHAFVSIAIPGDISVEYMDDIYDGMKELARIHDTNILGGDTTSSRSGLVINIAVTGSAPSDNLLYRNAAREGDLVFVTGPPGESRAGLHLILNDLPYTGHNEALYMAHVRPRPHIDEGLFLGSRDGVHAGIDISDGLSSDLGHIADESNSGFIIYADHIPVSDNLRRFCDNHGFDPVKYALEGGEDYVLAVTVDPAKAEAIIAEYNKRFEYPLVHIGEITGNSLRQLKEPGGKVSDLLPGGWDHFKG